MGALVLSGAKVLGFDPSSGGKDKEAKKLRQTNEAKKMIDAIFDIANEAYIHLAAEMLN